MLLRNQTFIFHLFHKRLILTFQREACVDCFKLSLIKHESNFTRHYIFLLNHTSDMDHFDPRGISFIIAKMLLIHFFKFFMSLSINLFLIHLNHDLVFLYQYGLLTNSNPLE
jgi:hypothetical protein